MVSMAEGEILLLKKHITAYLTLTLGRKLYYLPRDVARAQGVFISSNTHKRVRSHGLKTTDRYSSLRKPAVLCFLHMSTCSSSSGT